jgi:hypothetical protein
MILCVNKRFHTPTPHDFYCGRPSKLANPYTHLKSNLPQVIKVATREEAIDFFRAYFENNDFTAELEPLRSHYKKHGTLFLICWCAGKNGLTTKDKPFTCHSQIIAEELEKT